MKKYCLLLFLFVPLFLKVIHAQPVSTLSEEEENNSFFTHLYYESDPKEKYICYRGFVVYFNKDGRIPFYTIHKLTPQQITNQVGNIVKRRNNFFVDDKNVRDFSATSTDYKYGGYDRGHMVPAGDFVNDQELKDETFVYTNICPQNPNLNRGIWNHLENLIRKKISDCNCVCFIVSGTLIDSLDCEYIGVHSVAVPVYLYKIIYFPEIKIMYAFLFDNMMHTYGESISSYQIRVDDIERLTGEDFFDLLEDKEENLLESTIIQITE